MPLARLAAATFTRADNTLAVRGLTWEIAAGDLWAVAGPGGCGKTGLLESLAGRHRLTAGVAELPSAEFVGFRERSRRFDHLAHHHAGRFNPSDPLLAVAVADYLGADPGPFADRLGVAPLLGRQLLALSNGENRRVRLVRAVLRRPPLLLLDDPFLGLDPTGRAALGGVLTERSAAGLATVLTCRPDRVPAWATRVLHLGPADSRPSHVTLPGAAVGEPLVELRDVTVCHAGATILDRVTWTVRRGERWHLAGPNGAGKSTLLSVVAGDHPQAYSNDVRLFGRRRGSGETVWEVKRRIGLVSPEFHLTFGEPLTARRAAATGFSDTLLSPRTTPDQDAAVADLFAAFGLTAVAEVPFARLPGGAQRLVLVARALVKRPDLLLLDEPFQGLDADAAGRVRGWLADHLLPRQAVVLVTHHPDELPAGLTHTLRLEAGRAAVH